VMVRILSSRSGTSTTTQIGSSVAADGG